MLNQNIAKEKHCRLMNRIVLGTATVLKTINFYSELNTYFKHGAKCSILILGSKVLELKIHSMLDTLWIEYL